MRAHRGCFFYSFFLFGLVLNCTANPAKPTIEDFIVKIIPTDTLISLTDHPNTVIEKLGKPNNTSTKVEYNYTSLEYRGFAIGYFADAAYLDSIELTATDALTRRGAFVGMSKQRVLSLYGTPQMVDDGSIIYSFTFWVEPEKVPKDLILLFELSGEDLVKTITLYTDW
jgi:hypothetical protein